MIPFWHKIDTMEGLGEKKMTERLMEKAGNLVQEFNKRAIKRNFLEAFHLTTAYDVCWSILAMMKV